MDQRQLFRYMDLIRERKVFYTSDTHYGHTNVIRYCKRPFCTWRGDEPEPDVQYMNREMVRRWNSVVGPRDVVFHLGDFAMGKRHEMKPIISKLNGYKILIKGNHDRSAQAMQEAGFDEVLEELFIPRENFVKDIFNEKGDTVDDVLVDKDWPPALYMHHQPIRHWRQKGRGQTVDYHLCGHVHEKWRRLGDIINVGVDQWDFTPQTLEQLLTAEKQGEIATAEQLEEG